MQNDRLYDRPADAHTYLDINLREVRLRRVDMHNPEFIYKFLLASKKENEKIQKDLACYEEGLATIKMMKST